MPIGDAKTVMSGYVLTMLTDAVIIITGSAGPLGQAIGRRAAKWGARLALFERDDALAQRAQELLATAGVDNKQMQAYSADVRDAKALERAISSVHSDWGAINGLVNNAAILSPEDYDPVSTPLSVWNDTWAVNATGSFLMCQLTLPHLLKSQGAIVNMSSVVAHAASAIPQIAYTASKGAIEAMTREIAITYARQGVRANCVAPGPVRTERNAHLFASQTAWEKRQRYIPMGRMGVPDDISGMVCFLLGSEAQFITGGTFFVDGGISAAYIADPQMPETSATSSEDSSSEDNT